jgi:predicted  nucleic acid-binding Zn-ribbon protein
MNRSSQLLELQLIDSQIDKNQNRRLVIKKILDDDKEIISAEKQLEAVEEEFKTISKSLRDAEHKVQDQRNKIHQTDTKLYGGTIKNPKELQDLQLESKSLKRYLRVLEDRQLELMLEFDDAKEMVAQAQVYLDKILEKTENAHTDLKKENSKITGENKYLLSTRKEKISTISQADIEIYERLRKQRFGVAVSEVIDRACSACGATLTAALAQAARFPSQISYCETCGRILCSN